MRQKYLNDLSSLNKHRGKIINVVKTGGQNGMLGLMRKSGILSPPKMLNAL
jgi:hypothetical protein